MEGLERELAAERKRAAEAHENLSRERLQRAGRVRRARTGAVAVLAVLGVLAATLGPNIVRWQAAMAHDNRWQISIISAMAWLGICCILAWPKSWQIVLPGVVVTAILAAVALM